MLYNQPQSGPLQIDSSNPLSRWLVYASTTGAGGADRATSFGTFSKAATPTGLGDVFDATVYKTPKDLRIGKMQRGTIFIRHRSTVLAPNGPTFSQMLASTADSTTRNGLIFMLQNGASVLQVQVYTSSGSAASITAGAALNDGKIHTSAVTFDLTGSGSVILYQDNTPPVSAAIITSVTPVLGLTIGASPDPFWGKFQGVMEDVLVYDRIITPEEFASLRANPYQVWVDYEEEDEYTPAAGTGGITGTLAAQESGDTLAASGAVTLAAITGNATASEGVDTLASSGSTGFATITGTLARSEGIDTLVAAGAIGNAITGSLTVSEGIDIGLAAGTVTNAVITASLAASEGSDSLVASGSLVFVPITGSLARSESPDTLTALGGYAAVTGTVYYRYMRQSKTKIVHYEQE